MIDISTTCAPKSDQINADDLIGGPRTIRITRVSANPDSAEQPISVYFDGDDGKPYKPCKSMRRVMVHCWGKDGTAYVGRSLTIYRDASVQFGGMKVGGIRISHMSELTGDVTMALTATRASRKPYKVAPLAAPPREDAAAKWADGYIALIDSTETIDALVTLENSRVARLDELKAKRPELHARVVSASRARAGELARKGKPADEFGEVWGGDIGEAAE